jgi:hypothetical protein
MALQGSKAWQLRLATAEDKDVQKLADQRRVSKNDVVRQGLRMLLKVEKEMQAGARLFIERSDGEKQLIEVWFV